MKSRFHEAVEHDLTTNSHYYNEASTGLGDQFVAEVRAAVEFLETYPEGARVVSGAIRGKTLVRFPHTLLYVVEKKEVVILAVAHQRQDFEEWLRIAPRSSPAVQLAVAPDAARFVARRPSRLVLCACACQLAKL